MHVDTEFTLRYDCLLLLLFLQGDVGTHFTVALLWRWDTFRIRFVPQSQATNCTKRGKKVGLCLIMPHHCAPAFYSPPRLRSDIMLIQPSRHTVEIVFNENKKMANIRLFTISYQSQHKANPTTKVVAQLDYHSIFRQKSDIAKQCTNPTRKQIVEGVSNLNES